MCVVKRHVLKPHWSSQIKFHSFGLELYFCLMSFGQCLVSCCLLGSTLCVVSFGQCLVNGVFWAVLYDWCLLGSAL